MREINKHSSLAKGWTYCSLAIKLKQMWANPFVYLLQSDLILCVFNLLFRSFDGLGSEDGVRGWQGGPRNVDGIGIVVEDTISSAVVIRIGFVVARRPWTLMDIWHMAVVSVCWGRPREHRRLAFFPVEIWGRASGLAMWDFSLTRWVGLVAPLTVVLRVYVMMTHRFSFVNNNCFTWFCHYLDRQTDFELIQISTLKTLNVFFLRFVSLRWQKTKRRGDKKTITVCLF